MEDEEYTYDYYDDHLECGCCACCGCDCFDDEEDEED